MLYLITKALISGLIIMAASEAAKRRPTHLKERATLIIPPKVRGHGSFPFLSLPMLRAPEEDPKRTLGRQQRNGWRIEIIVEGARPARID